MPSPTDVGNFYSRFSPDYDSIRFRSIYHRRVAKQEQNFILSHIPQNGKVLEVGAGTGRFTQELVKVANSVLATDISDGMLSILQSKVSAENLFVEQISIENLSSLQDYGTFDSVICMRVLPHFSNIPDALQQMRGAVRDGGVVLFDLWNNNSFIGLLRSFRRIESKVFTQFLSYSAMLKLIQAANFDIRASTGWGYPHLYCFQWDKYLFRLFSRWAYSVIFCVTKDGK